MTADVQADGDARRARVRRKVADIALDLARDWHDLGADAPGLLNELMDRAAACGETGTAVRALSAGFNNSGPNGE